MLKRSLSCLLAVIMFTALFAGFSFASDEQVQFIGTTKVSTLHMRNTPSTDGGIIRDYKKGTQVTILENDGNWCYVSVGDLSGYMMTKYLDIKSNLPHVSWGKTADEIRILTIYAAPDENAAVKTRFYSGAILDVIEKGTNGWLKVRLNDQVGYIQSETITDYDTTTYNISSLKSSMSPYSLITTPLTFVTKEYGDEITVNGYSGETEYTFTYPITGIGSADAVISSWLKKLKKNTAQAVGSTLEVDYESYQADERYVSVILSAEYKDSVSSCTTLLGFNIDLVTGNVLYGSDLCSNISRVNLVVESRIGKFFLTPAEGYKGIPDKSWLNNAVLTSDGLCVYLPSGIYLPVSLGAQKIQMSYRELSGFLSFDSTLATASYIDPKKPMVCLTFDDGPSEYTPLLLDLLAEYGGHASFCVLGNRVEDYASTIKRIAAEGSEIVSHTYGHKKLTTLSNSNARYQISQVEVEVNKIIDYDIKWLRCPYGSNNKMVRSICADLGMSVAFWEIDTLDWSTKSPSKTFSKIKSDVKSGDIILCHDLYAETYQAMQMAIPWLVEQGYQLVTLSEMFQYYEGGVQVGTTYLRMSDESNAALLHPELYP